MDQRLQHKSQLVLTTVTFNFGRKKDYNLSFRNGNFLTICGHCFVNYINISNKTKIHMVILRYVVGLNLYWIKSYDMILITINFLSCLKTHHFRVSLPKWVLTLQKETSSQIFKKGIFWKNFGPFMRQIIRLNASKKIKWFY